MAVTSNAFRDIRMVGGTPDTRGSANAFARSAVLRGVGGGMPDEKL